MKQDLRQMSDRFRLGAVLALAGGYLDAYTYLVRGGVFANAQTGNMILLGIALMRGQLSAVGRYLPPVLAFAAGVVAAELTRRAFREHPKVHWRQIVLGVEVLLLAVVGFLPPWAEMGSNLIVSFVCAMQVESFRKFGGNVYATTMCTGNLRSGTEQIYRFFTAHDRQALTRGVQYFGILLVFVLGAALGALGAGVLAGRSVLVCCVVLACAVWMMCSQPVEAE